MSSYKVSSYKVSCSNVLFVGLFSLSCFACAKPPAPEPQTKVAEAKVVTMPSPEEMMKVMDAAATPGEHHAKLQVLVGKWKAVSKMWMDPTQPPVVSKGNARFDWILGKRFVRQTFNGNFHGKPFQGEGVIGYDNIKKEYFSTWIDSLGTGLMLSQGNFATGANDLEMSNTFTCPLAGEIKGRTVLRLVGKNEVVFEMYNSGPDGKEIKGLEVSYTRHGR